MVTFSQVAASVLSVTLVSFASLIGAFLLPVHEKYITIMLPTLLAFGVGAMSVYRAPSISFLPCSNPAPPSW